MDRLHRLRRFANRRQRQPQSSSVTDKRSICQGNCVSSGARPGPEAAFPSRKAPEECQHRDSTPPSGAAGSRGDRCQRNYNTASRFGCRHSGVALREVAGDRKALREVREVAGSEGRVREAV